MGENLTIEEKIKIFGPPPPRKPIPSNSFNYLVKMYSIISPHDNPFAQYANLPEYTRTIDYGAPILKRQNSGNVHDDFVVDRVEEESSDEVVEPGNMYMISLRNDTSVTASVPFTDDNFSGSEKTRKMCSNLDIGASVANTLAAKTGKIRLAVEGDMEEDVVSEEKKKNVEVDKLASESYVANYLGNHALDKEVSNQIEANNHYADTGFGNFQYKEQKRCNEKVTNELSEQEGRRYYLQKCSNKGALISSSNSANSIDLGNASGISMKRKSKKAKKAPRDDVVSAKHKKFPIQGEAPNSTKLTYVEPLIHEKMVKKHEVGIIEKPSTKKVKKGQDKSSKGVLYTREQLLCLQNKSSVSEDILRAVQVIVADLHDECLHSASEEIRVSCSDERKRSPFEGNEAKEMEIGDANKENPSFLTDDKLATEENKDAIILKKKKRGSSSEARKEKKKRQRRKKRAELNKKLGVKRLKLRPNIKPKVVSHCRHYLNGRCHEGEKCKFSHDVIPLTKSKPCCHFARNECLKGNDCPYDHQLSKYPCNNYVTTGFCIRGDSCSFSHKALPAERDEAISNASTVLASAPNSLKGDNSVKLTKPLSNPPKGISFFSFEKSSVEDSSKHKGGTLSHQNTVVPNLAGGFSSKRSHDGTSIIEHMEPVLCVSKCDSRSLLPFDESNPEQKLDATTSLETGHESLNNLQEPNYATLNSLHGISARPTSHPANPPKGISFLSFGNSSVEDSSVLKGELSHQNHVLPNTAVGSSKQSDYGKDASNEIRQGLLSGRVNVPQMFKINQVSSSSELSHVSSGGKSHFIVPSHVHNDSSIGDIGAVNYSDKWKTVQPANPPKGISYFSFGNSAIEGYSKHTEELSQKNIFLPYGAVGSSSKQSDHGTDTNNELSQGLLGGKVKFSRMVKANQVSSSSGLSHVSLGGKSQAIVPSHAHTDSLIGEIGAVNNSDKWKTVQPANPPKGISYFSLGNSSDEGSSKHKKELAQKNVFLPCAAVGSSSKHSDYGTYTNNELSHGLLGGRVNFSQMVKANQVSSSSGLSYVNSGGKSQATIPSHVHTGSLIGKLGTANVPEKLKTVQPELPDSSTSFGQFSAMVGGVRNTPSAAAKSLASTLGFAEKYGSAVKMTSEASFKVADKSESTSDSRFKQNEESKVSAILQFLYSGRNKGQE